MLRPGRIDRIYKVGYPQVEGRIATFDYYLAKVRHELSDEQVEQLATITPYASGASIKDMVNEALVIAIRDGREVDHLDGHHQGEAAEGARAPRRPRVHRA